MRHVLLKLIREDLAGIRAWRLVLGSPPGASPYGPVKIKLSDGLGRLSGMSLLHGSSPRKTQTLVLVPLEFTIEFDCTIFVFLSFKTSLMYKPGWLSLETIDRLECKSYIKRM